MSLATQYYRRLCDRLSCNVISLRNLEERHYNIKSTDLTFEDAPRCDRPIVVNGHDLRQALQDDNSITRRELYAQLKVHGSFQVHSKFDKKKNFFRNLKFHSYLHLLHVQSKLPITENVGTEY